MSMYYDRQGQPMKLSEWAEKFEDRAYKQVARTVFPNDVRVSTVWLGMDHGFNNRLPIIFETMVFGKNAARGDTYQERYVTESEALAGHERITAVERAALDV